MSCADKSERSVSEEAHGIVDFEKMDMNNRGDSPSKALELGLEIAESTPSQSPEALVARSNQGQEEASATHNSNSPNRIPGGSSATDSRGSELAYLGESVELSGSGTPSYAEFSTNAFSTNDLSLHKQSPIQSATEAKSQANPKADPQSMAFLASTLPLPEPEAIAFKYLSMCDEATKTNYLKATRSASKSENRTDDAGGGGDYKTNTVICRSHLTDAECKFQANSSNSARCQYAHGISALRPRMLEGNLKTELCANYHGTIMGCPYGELCHFLHDEFRIQVGPSEFWLVNPSNSAVRVELTPPNDVARRAFLESVVNNHPDPANPTLKAPALASALEIEQFFIKQLRQNRAKCVASSPSPQHPPQGPVSGLSSPLPQKETTDSVQTTSPISVSQRGQLTPLSNLALPVSAVETRNDNHSIDTSGVRGVPEALHALGPLSPSLAASSSPMTEGVTGKPASMDAEAMPSENHLSATKHHPTEFLTIPFTEKSIQDALIERGFVVQPHAGPYLHTIEVELPGSKGPRRITFSAQQPFVFPPEQTLGEMLESRNRALTSSIQQYFCDDDDDGATIGIGSEGKVPTHASPSDPSDFASGTSDFTQTLPSSIKSLLLHPSTATPSRPEPGVAPAPVVRVDPAVPLPKHLSTLPRSILDRLPVFLIPFVMLFPTGLPEDLQQLCKAWTKKTEQDRQSMLQQQDEMLAQLRQNSELSESSQPQQQSHMQSPQSPQQQLLLLRASQHQYQPGQQQPVFPFQSFPQPSGAHSYAVVQQPPLYHGIPGKRSVQHDGYHMGQYHSQPQSPFQHQPPSPSLSQYQVHSQVPIHATPMPIEVIMSLRGQTQGQDQPQAQTHFYTHPSSQGPPSRQL